MLVTLVESVVGLSSNGATLCKRPDKGQYQSLLEKNDDEPVSVVSKEVKDIFDMVKMLEDDKLPV